MVTIQCSFRERIRLLQLVGGFQAIGTPQLRECSRLLDIVEPNREEAAAVDLVIDVARDHIGWDDKKVAALNPQYKVSFDRTAAAMLVGILDASKLNPIADRWLLPVVDQLKAIL